MTETKFKGQTKPKLNDIVVKSEQKSHAVAGKPRDAAVNSDRYQQPVG